LGRTEKYFKIDSSPLIFEIELVNIKASCP
jgi:hypothetical protein